MESEVRKKATVLFKDISVQCPDLLALFDPMILNDAALRCIMRIIMKEWLPIFLEHSRDPNFEDWGRWVEVFEELTRDVKWLWHCLTALLEDPDVMQHLNPLNLPGWRARAEWPTEHLNAQLVLMVSSGTSIGSDCSASLRRKIPSVFSGVTTTMENKFVDGRRQFSTSITTEGRRNLIRLFRDVVHMLAA